MFFNQAKDIEYWAAFPRFALIYLYSLVLLPECTKLLPDREISKSKLHFGFVAEETITHPIPQSRFLGKKKLCTLRLRSWEPETAPTFLQHGSVYGFDRCSFYEASSVIERHGTSVSCSSEDPVHNDVLAVIPKMPEKYDVRYISLGQSYSFPNTLSVSVSH